MIDLNSLLNIVAVAISVVSIVATGAVLRELLTGSYKRYIEKRNLHRERFQRTQDELLGDKRND